MLRVTIEMLPGGSETHKRHLGTIEIANDGTGTASTGNYKVRLAKSGRPQQTWKRGAVTNFPRGTCGPYDLLLRALVAVIGPRNKRFVDELREDEQAPLRAFVAELAEKEGVMLNGNRLSQEAREILKGVTI